MNWEVGKEYKSRDGCPYTLVAIIADGRLIFERVGSSNLVYRQPDGCYRSEGPCLNWDIINDEPTDMERDIFEKLYRAMYGYKNGSYLNMSELRNPLKRCLPILREILNQK